MNHDKCTLKNELCIMYFTTLTLTIKLSNKHFKTSTLQHALCNMNYATNIQFAIPNVLSNTYFANFLKCNYLVDKILSKSILVQKLWVKKIEEYVYNKLDPKIFG